MISLDYVNTQPAEKPDYNEDGSLEIHSIFATIQGEGPLAGMPAIFVRTAGCNLACEKCDTDYTSTRNRYTPSELLKAIHEVNATGIRLIVLTGGEPFRQNITPFVLKALSHYNVQIETNGTLAPDDLPLGSFGLSIVCSPKTPKVNPTFDIWASFKYILKAGEEDPLDGLPLQSLDSGLRPARPETRIYGAIYVQPLDEGDAERNKLNAKACVDVCMKYGYRLSLQQHKLLELP